MKDKYYYTVMNVAEKEAYKAIYNGITQRALNIVVPLDVEPEVVQETYLKVLYDNPQFYYINQTVIRMVGKRGYYVLYPEFLYSVQEINALDRDIEKVIKKVAAKAEQYRSNEFRLEKFLHDSVVKSVAYDYDSLMKNDCYNAHSIVGAFLENKAVCEGIAKAFKLLCNEFGMKCIVVLGKADKDGKFDNKSFHAWNLVKIGNEAYHVDVTWDNMHDKEPRFISYDYFNLTTKEILLDHRPIGTLPECTATRLNYFHSTKSFVSTYNEMFTLINNRLNDKKIMFCALKNRGEFTKPDEVRHKTVSALFHAMYSRGEPKSFAMSFNELRNIVNIIFLPEKPYKIELQK